MVVSALSLASDDLSEFGLVIADFQHLSLSSVQRVANRVTHQLTRVAHIFFLACLRMLLLHLVYVLSADAYGVTFDEGL